jgi:hypothetical protein
MKKSWYIFRILKNAKDDETIAQYMDFKQALDRARRLSADYCSPIEILVGSAMILRWVQADTTM